MSAYDPSGSSAQSWVMGASAATLITAGVGTAYVIEPVRLMSFLGWETAVFMCTLFSIFLSLFGLCSSVMSRSGKSSSFYWWNKFGILSLYHVYAVLYLCLHTMIAQPLAFYELKKHWVITSWRFPQFKHLNQTQAIESAEEYYNSTVTIITILAVLLLLLHIITVTCVVRTVNKKVLYSQLLSITNVLAAMIGIVLVGFGVLQMKHSEFYGVRAQVPLQIFLNAVFFLGIACFGVRAIRANAKTLRCTWCVYFWWVILAFSTVIGCAIASTMFLEKQFTEIDETDMDVVHKASSKAGLPAVEWTKNDFKQVLNAHFSQIFALLIFLGMTIITILISSGYVRSFENKSGYRQMRVQ